MSEMRKLMETLRRINESSWESVRDRAIEDEIQWAREVDFDDLKNHLRKLKRLRLINDPKKFVSAYKRVTGVTDWDLPDELYSLGIQKENKQIAEGYFKNLDIELQRFRRANKDLMPTELIRLAWKKYGPETAKYLSDQLEMEGDLADYKASDSQPHLREDNLPQFDDLLRAKAYRNENGGIVTRQGPYQYSVVPDEDWPATPGVDPRRPNARGDVSYEEFLRGDKVKESKDMTGEPCKECGKGTYQETSIHDDWDGVLHCDNDDCRHETKRHIEETLYDSKINKLEPNYPIVRSKWQKELRKKLADVDVSDYPWAKKKAHGDLNEGIGWFTKKYDTKIAKKVAEEFREDGLKLTVISIQYVSQGKGAKIVRALKRYLKHSPDGEYFAEVSQILPAVETEEKWLTDTWNDTFPNNKMDEAIVTVPAELRGNIAMTAHATSGDAFKFIKDLDIDDEVSNTVVDPETGEVLFEPGQTKREDMKIAAQALSNVNDYNSAQPFMHAGYERDYEEIKDAAHDLLNKLRNNDFYHVVWQPISKMIDDPEAMMDKDYDVEYDVPVILKRKDGKQLDAFDHENIREIIRAVKNASTMQNVGIMFMGTTNNGTTARFMPSFI